MSTSKTTQDHNIQIVEAVYTEYNEVSPVRSDVREQGFDLSLFVRNWPEGANPDYLVYRQRKSFPAELTGNSDNGVVIEARIIVRSAVMAEVSERIELSDRLVFIDRNGNSDFIEIQNWTRKAE
ncbi:MAG: hypothetical protein ACFCU6_07790 [Balneolaceae bacterium]